MAVDQFKSDLRVLSINELYNNYLISGDVWVFKNLFGDKWHDKYDEFRLFVSDKLKVHYNDIAVAGSAKLGFSINPNKNYKIFDSSSDIDIIIISQRLYIRFWNAYIRDSYANIRTKDFNKVCFSIFRRYISVDNLNIRNEDYISWTKQTGGFEKDLQVQFHINNDIHYRIFESWDAAKLYYLSSFKKLKDEMEVV